MWQPPCWFPKMIYILDHMFRYVLLLPSPLYHIKCSVNALRDKWRQINQPFCIWYDAISVNHSILWNDAISDNHSVLWNDAISDNRSLLWNDAISDSNLILWNDAIFDSNSILWNDAISDNHSILWDDAISDNYSILWNAAISDNHSSVKASRNLPKIVVSQVCPICIAL